MPFSFRLPADAALGAARFHISTAFVAASLPVIAFSAAALPLQAQTPADNVPEVAQTRITAAKGILSRKITGAPARADALRVTILGDGSGGSLQMRILQTGQTGTLGGFYAAPPVSIDWKGWKTITFPLSTFAFSASTNPTAQSDGTPGVGQLGANASELQMVIVAPTTRLFFDDLGWASAGDAPDAPLLAVLDTFDAPKSAWSAIGDWEEQRSVSSGPVTIAQYVKTGTGALQVIVRTPGLNEQQLREPALIPRLQKTPGQGFVVFSRPALQDITLESTPIPREKTATLVAMSACADETESGAFAVFAARALKGATVKLGGPLTLKGGGASIPASAVDLHVVRFSSDDPDGLQLLLKDDRQVVDGPTAKVRLTGDPVTDIPQNASKKFWVTVKVPARQKPGIYTSKLVLSAPGAKPLGIPLTVEVLPLPIKTAFLQYGIDVRSRLGAGGPLGEDTVSPERFAQQLADIREHGFGFVVLHDKPGPDLMAALKLYKEAGLASRGPVVIASPVTASDVSDLEAAKKTLGFAPDFLFYYAFPPEALQSSDAASRYASDINSVSRASLLVANVDSRATYTTLGSALGVPNYNVSSDYAQGLIANGRRGTSNRDWWNWNIGSQSPETNRYLAGFLLYRTGSSSSPLYGALPGPYETAVVPVEGGIVRSVQWEAVREGIDDIRYIGILKGLIRELRDLKAYKKETDLADSYLIGALAKPLIELSPSDQQDIRRNIIERALNLQTLLAKANKGR